MPRYEHVKVVGAVTHTGPATACTGSWAWCIDSQIPELLTLATAIDTWWPAVNAFMTTPVLPTPAPRATTGSSNRSNAPRVDSETARTQPAGSIPTAPANSRGQPRHHADCPAKIEEPQNGSPSSGPGALGAGMRAGIPDVRPPDRGRTGVRGRLKSKRRKVGVIRRFSSISRESLVSGRPTILTPEYVGLEPAKSLPG